MFDTSPDFTTFGDAASTSLDEFRSFAAAHRDALLDAAGLLGGSPGLRLAHAALDGLAGQGTPSRRVMRAFYQFLDLLMLEHVHDPSRIEAERCAMIDPASACVEEICLLADQLSDLLDACRKAETADDSADRRAAA